MHERVFIDPATSSNTDEARVEHLDIKWEVSFTKRKLYGQVSLKIRLLKDTNKIILDSRWLEIHSVSLNDTLLSYVIEDAGFRGQKIIINIGDQKSGKSIILNIDYETGEKCTALQFLTPEQTSDKEGPFLFSQCQEIFARSIVPCMDTPSIKQTYNAKVKVPSDTICLMSAISTHSRVEKEFIIYYFEQQIKIPSYLLAIVAGVLEKRDISERCAVWAEPSVVDVAHCEFEEIETILRIAEDLMGEYVWGRYDMVVLPASFPFGGMENPCLTFVTPTCITGDRSLVNLIAHEISHSWTGNLVTNATWEHFWLNEGFTMFMERKIIGRLHGESLRQFNALIGWEDELTSTISTLSPENPLTKLVQDHRDIDPEDSFSPIHYEKGFALLFYLDSQLGDSVAFEKFLKAYIQKFKGESLITSDWLDFLYESFPEKKEILNSIDWQGWLHEPGFPPNKPKYDEEMMREVKSLFNQWKNQSEADIKAFKADDFISLNPDQRIKFLNLIHQDEPLAKWKIEKLTELYSLSATKNAEIQFRWIQIGIKSRWTKILPHAYKFVSTVGRIKFSQPLYKELFLWNESANEAVKLFKENIPKMHPITVGYIEKLLKT